MPDFDETPRSSKRGVKPDFEDVHDQLDDQDPAICFVKAYARKPIGVPSSNLIPVDKRQNGIDWNDSYFYNMMEDDAVSSEEEDYSDDITESEDYSDAASSEYGSELDSSSGSEYSYYSDSSNDSNDIGFDSSEENSYEIDSMEELYYDDNDLYEDELANLGFSDEEDNEIGDDAGNYPRRRRRRGQLHPQRRPTV